MTYVSMIYLWRKMIAPTKPNHNVKAAQKAPFFSNPIGGRQTRKSPR